MTNASTATTNTASTAIVHNQLLIPSFPSEIPIPKPLKLDRIDVKKSWDNYRNAVVVRLQRFDEEYETATFRSAVNEEALEIYEDTTINLPKNSKVLN